LVGFYGLVKCSSRVLFIVMYGLCLLLVCIIIGVSLYSLVHVLPLLFTSTLLEFWGLKVHILIAELNSRGLRISSFPPR